MDGINAFLLIVMALVGALVIVMVGVRWYFREKWRFLRNQFHFSNRDNDDKEN